MSRSHIALSLVAILMAAVIFGLGGPVRSTHAQAQSETLVGRIDGTDAFVAVVTDGNIVTAYACDGANGSIANAFSGDLNNAANGALTLTTADSSDLLTLNADQVGAADALASGSSLTGFLTTAADRVSHPWTADPASGPGGLYHADDVLPDGNNAEGWWVVLNNGDVRGIGNNNPFPAGNPFGGNPFAGNQFGFNPFGAAPTVNPLNPFAVTPPPNPFNPFVTANPFATTTGMSFTQFQPFAALQGFQFSPFSPQATQALLTGMATAPFPFAQTMPMTPFPPQILQQVVQFIQATGTVPAQFAPLFPGVPIAGAIPPQFPSMIPFQAPGFPMFPTFQMRVAPVQSPFLF